MMYVDVIMPLHLEGMLTYALPEQLVQGVSLGVRLLVPLGDSKTYTAIAVKVHDVKPEFEVKKVLAVLDDAPMLLRQQYKLWQWISDYYMSTLGDIYIAAMPSGLKAEDGYRPKTETYVGLRDEFRNAQSLRIAFDMLKQARRQKQVLTDFLRLTHWDTLNSGLPAKDIKEITQEELMNVSHCARAIVKNLIDRHILYTYEVEVGRLNVGSASAAATPKKLNDGQSTAYNDILLQFMRKEVVLLHGVTSSGKTEIYIHLILRALKEHKQVLYLLPEIALTVQIMERLRKVFGDRLGIYHSKYSDAERVEIWKKQLSDTPYDVILGARSAIFLPFQRLGMVIVDEEHENSFKQQEPPPYYNARSAAIVLAHMYGAKVLLGTATPSAETYYNALQGKYGLVRLMKRYKDIQLPHIEVVDVKDLRRRKMMTTPFSPMLLAAIRDALAEGKQAILFQNRRGFAPQIECKTCGWVPRCKNCDVSLTYHKNFGQLTCHYCGYTYPLPTQCPCCEGRELKGMGYGTEKIEDYIRELLPEARVARMDLDTTRTKNAYERLIADFSTGKTNILIGTQMVSKGLDFDNVAVVGILDADSMLNYPDFRSYEHAFMMMAQVSGRAGRKGARGRVILQTKNPDNPVIRQVVGNNYETFFHDLMDERRLFHYPPFFRLVYIYLKHGKEQIVESASIEMGSRLRQWFGERILGPDKPAVARVRQQSIRKIVVKLETGIDLQQVRHYLRLTQKQILQDKRYATLQIFYDVDPV